MVELTFSTAFRVDMSQVLQCWNVPISTGQQAAKGTQRNRQFIGIQQAGAAGRKTIFTQRLGIPLHSFVGSQQTEHTHRFSTQVRWSLDIIEHLHQSISGFISQKQKGMSKLFMMLWMVVKCLHQVRHYGFSAL